MPRLFIFIAFSTLILWSSCKHDPIGPGQLAPPEPFICESPVVTDYTNDCDQDTVYYSQIAVLLNASCGSAAMACHFTANDDNSEVDLSSYEGIINSDIIDFDEADESEIVDEIADGDMPPSDGQMILNDHYSAELQNMLITWIEQGALENECISDCDTTQVASFGNDIYPIIYYNCISCHWDESLNAGVCLTNYESIKTYALNGKLVRSIKWQTGVEPMPFASNKIPQCDIDLITNWVNNGAPNN